MKLSVLESTAMNERIESVIKELRERRQTLADGLLNGLGSSPNQYHQTVGEGQGLLQAITLLEEALKKDEE